MLIPENSQKVFEGKLFTIYQWEQELYDGTTTIFEVAERKPSVDCLATVGNQIIVLWQEQPGRAEYPALPGGWREEGETPMFTIKRELLEETGYSSEELIQVDEYTGTSKYFFQETQFVARNCKKISEPQLDAGEKIRVELMEYDHFLQLCRRPDFAIPVNLRMKMYEALLDPEKKEQLRITIFGK